MRAAVRQWWTAGLAVMALSGAGCQHGAAAQASSGTGAVQGAQAPGDVAQVSPAWLQAHPDAARVVDVREVDELTGPLGHLGFAESVPLGQLASQAAGWDRQTPVVLVCRSGRRATRAAQQLEQLGFQHVSVLTGGMEAWRAQGLPVEGASPQPDAAGPR